MRGWLGVVAIVGLAACGNGASTADPGGSSSARGDAAQGRARSGNRELYAFAADIPRLIASSSGGTPRFLRVELLPNEAHVLAVTKEEPNHIKSYTIKGSAVTLVEEPSALLTPAFEVADVDWGKLGEMAAGNGMRSGIDVEERVLGMVILPNDGDGGAGAMIQFTVSHSSPSGKREYKGPAK